MVKVFSFEIFDGNKDLIKFWASDKCIFPAGDGVL